MGMGRYLKSFYQRMQVKRKNKILLVEDEPSLAMILKDTLKSQGYEVLHSIDGQDALETYFDNKPDLIVLDVMLPKTNGYSVAKTIRNTDQLTPIIFLTAKSQVKDLVLGFESGGNDYLRKPFSIEELIVRIKVMLSDSRLLHHADVKEEEIEFELGKIYFNSNKQQLIVNEKTLKLTAKESDLLKLFCQNKNRLVSKQTILLKIWGNDSFFTSRSMDVFVSKLRKHLKAEPTLRIMNIRGIGYKLIVD